MVKGREGMSTVRNPPPAFRVGDWVSFLFGTRQVRAQVVEDRGPLGINRRRIYQVRVDRDAEEPMTFEMPESELAATGAPIALPAPEKSAVMRYLKQGGLLEILRSNLSGGRNQPVWLTQDALGGLTYTFIADRGLIGGRKAPFSALHENKVFLPKKEDVFAFLTSFGLTREDAEDVLREVGTAP
jgi:hypothetical protein